MNEDMKALYIKVKGLLDNNKLSIFLTNIQVETVQQDEEVTFGHTFSTTSYMGFEKAVCI